MPRYIAVTQARCNSLSRRLPHEVTARLDAALAPSAVYSKRYERFAALAEHASLNGLSLGRQPTGPKTLKRIALDRVMRKIPQ